MMDMEERIAQLQVQVRDIESSNLFNEEERSSRLRELQAKLRKEEELLKQGKNRPAKVRFEEKDEKEEEFAVRRKRRMEKALMKEEMDKFTKRLELSLYVGLPLLALVVSLLAYTWRDSLNFGALPVPKMVEPETVQTLSWSPDRDVADEIFADNKPLLLTNTVASQWPAFKKWTFEYLAEKNPLLDEIYRSPSPGFQHFSEGRILKKFLGLNPKFQISESSAKDFLHLFNSTDDYKYWSGSVQEIGLQDDIIPTAPLAIQKLPTMVNAWISSKGVTALLHYDMYYNCFVQIKGKKKFTLFPPSDWKYLYLHPYHHPAHRQSQVNLLEPDFRRFPLLRHSKPLEVIVEEGQVLFLPPLWFHQVEALDDSISVNVWSHSDPMKECDEIFYLAVPFSEDWSQQQLYDAAKVYITMLVEYYHGPSSAANFVGNIVKSRFKSLPPEQQSKFRKPTEQNYCSPKIDEGPLRSEMKRGIAQMRKYLDPLSRELQSVIIEDFIQDLILFVVGIDRLPAYLEACFML